MPTGLAQIIPNTPGFYPAIEEYSLPGTLDTGLLFNQVMFQGVNNALPNRADPTKPATVAGAPVELSGYLAFTGGLNYLIEQMTSTHPEFSCAIIGRSTSSGVGIANQAMWISDYGGTASNASMSLRQNTGDQVRTVMNVHDVNGNAALVQAGDLNLTPGQMSAIYAYFTETDTGVANLKTGTNFTAAATAGYTRNVIATPLRVGSSAATNYQGVCELAIALGWSRKLTAPEQAQLYTWLASFAATAGIVL